MSTEKVQTLGALGMVVVALLVVAYLAAVGNDTALGALISIITAGTSFFLRGRVQSSNS